MTASTEGAVLVARGLTKRYSDRTVLDGVDLTVQAGEVLGLLGPNGAGKSTLVGIIAGIVRADGGEATVDGVPSAKGGRDLARRVGLAPQDIGVYPVLTVRQNLELFAELSGMRRRDARARAEELLEPMALAELAERTVGQLSGGEQRRVHTAAALVHRPKLLILDEPTAGADPQTRDGILQIVRETAASGAAIVYTTHYLPEVEQVASRVALLERGRVIAHGTLDDLIAAHAAAALIVELVEGHGLELPQFAAAIALAATAEGRVRLQLRSDDPAALLHSLVTDLGERSSLLLGVELVQPSLEAAYLQLTGRRTANEETA